MKKLKIKNQKLKFWCRFATIEKKSLFPSRRSRSIFLIFGF